VVTHQLKVERATVSSPAKTDVLATVPRHHNDDDNDDGDGWMTDEFGEYFLSCFVYHVLICF